MTGSIAAPAGAELPAAEGDELAALLHAAAATTEASGTASLTASGILAINEWIIFIVSSRAAMACGIKPHAAALSSCLTIQLRRPNRKGLAQQG